MDRISRHRLRVAHRSPAWLLILVVVGCTSGAGPQPSPTPTPASEPQVIGVTASAVAVGRYEKLEFVVDLVATYDNPYDLRQVDMMAHFSAPSGQAWLVPGFWDGSGQWRVRFGPPDVGTWRYEVAVRDGSGEARSTPGQFRVIPSPRHGWLQVGSWVDPAYSPRYLVHHDGAPFYGIGHANAFDLMSFGFDQNKGFTLFDTMQAHGENILVYWPLYSNPLFSQRYDTYLAAEMAIIDLIVEDAAGKGIYLIFTIWDHPALRGKAHPWGEGRWNTNGFRQLTDLRGFFTDPEAWAWQENLYRYIIARWGYSPAIGLWQTVTEIDGTEAFGQTDVWHARVNDYFVRHDPYRHPTTASMSGDRSWLKGFAEMDVLQVHSYDTQDDAVATGQRMTDWTQEMWRAAAKPNFIGEFGARDQRLQPGHLHNGVWAALVSGAAITPLDWNDATNIWGKMTPAMLSHLSYLAAFTADIPFGHIDLAPLTVTTKGHDLRAWAIGTSEFAIAWVQDVTPGEERTGDVLTLHGLRDGTYHVRLFDTWQGVYRVTRSAVVEGGQLSIDLPEFQEDLAVRVE